MGCHTWCYKVAEKQYTYDEVREKAIELTKNEIAFCEETLAVNESERLGYTVEQIDRAHKFYSRVLRFLEADKFPNGMYSIFVYWDMSCAVSEFHNGVFYVGDFCHDPFRIGGYPEDKLNSREECDAFILAKGDALWCDDAGLLAPGSDNDAVCVRKLLDDLEPTSPLQYFGGTEFKYRKQPKKEDLPWVYERACALIDVITTSGAGTGKEIDIEKLKRIRETIGDDKELAVASGINYLNIAEISKYANYLMVASSITEPNSEYIIEDALIKLIFYKSIITI